MNYITIEDKLYDIQHRAYQYSDLATAQRATAPLVWYVGTDRASISFLRALDSAGSRQITTIAKRLLKAGGMDYDASIHSVAEYLGVN